MKRQIVFIASLAVLGTAYAPAADPVILRLIPPDARLVYGANVGRIKTAPSWPLYQTLADPNRQRFRDIADSAGFDPRLHLEEIIVVEANNHSLQELVLLRGTFDLGRVAAIDRVPAQKKKAVYNGIEVLVPEPGDSRPDDVWEPLWTAVLPGHVAIGPRSMVTSAIDRYRSGAAASAFQSRVQPVRERFDAWVVGNGEIPAHRIRELLNQSDRWDSLFSRLWDYSAGISIGSSASAVAEVVTSSAEEAALMVNLAQMFALAKVFVAPERESVTELLQRLSFYSEGNRAKGALALMADEFDDWITLLRF